MNLKTLIQQELWQEISNSYEAENYKNAILDAMHYLSNILREKTGIDSDGTTLVGQSLGGDSPKLRINKMQTESERDEQKGFMQIIQGLYTGIRNPRSHEQIEDTKNNADPIIYFIDYITKIINASRPPFTLDEFLVRVYEPDFVENDRYAELLVNEIPSSKMLDVLIEVYRRRMGGEAKKLKYISIELISRLSDSDMEEFLGVVSEELDTATGDKEITSTIQMIPSQYWPKLKESTRMRIENKLIASIKSGEVILNSDRLREGALGTWARGLLDYFTLKTELTRTLHLKLEDTDVEDNLYVFKYFLSDLPTFFTTSTSIKEIVASMYRVVTASDNSNMLDRFDQLIDFLCACPSEWKTEILEQFKDLTDTKYPLYYLPDGTPFPTLHR